MLEERLQQIRQVQQEIEGVKADIRQLTAQVASGAKLAEQQVLHISELERIASYAGEQATALCFCIC